MHSNEGYRLILGIRLLIRLDLQMTVNENRIDSNRVVSTNLPSKLVSQFSPDHIIVIVNKLLEIKYLSLGYSKITSENMYPIKFYVAFCISHPFPFPSLVSGIIQYICFFHYIIGSSFKLDF